MSTNRVGITLKCHLATSLLIGSVVIGTAPAALAESLDDIANFAQSICGDIPEGHLTRTIIQQTIEARSEQYKGIPYDKLPDKIPTSSMCKSELVKVLFAARSPELRGDYLRSFPLGQSTISDVQMFLGTPIILGNARQQFEQRGYVVTFSYLAQNSSLGKKGTVTGIHVARNSVSSGAAPDAVQFNGGWNELMCSGDKCTPIVEPTSELGATTGRDFINTDCDQINVVTKPTDTDNPFRRLEGINDSTITCSIFTVQSNPPTAVYLHAPVLANVKIDLMVAIDSEGAVGQYGNRWHDRLNDLFKYAVINEFEISLLSHAEPVMHLCLSDAHC
jgi:hypothetical protein